MSDRLHTTAASIAAALRRAADDLDKLGHVELSPVAVQINLQAVSYRGTSEQRTGTVDRLGLALLGHVGTSEDSAAGHHSVPLDHRDRGDLEVAVYTAVQDFGSRE